MVSSLAQKHTPHIHTPALALLLNLLLAARLIADPLPLLDPNRARFPRSSLVDFSYLLDTPAGKHGFLEAREDGHFYFADGNRARFWGINIASKSVFHQPEVIDQIVDGIAKAGFNLVRIHHIDERNGILDLNFTDTRHLDESRLRILDYWIARLKARGIYTYLDLLDYRTFKSGDGVANADALGRGAKPYIIFNRQLIDLQKEYARQLLIEHVNTFTGLSYAQDPAVVMLELFDENGLFMKRNLWRRMPEPYQSEFRSLWNKWLRDQYGTTERLAKTWTNAEGQCSLMPSENLESGAVELPVMEPGTERGSIYAHSPTSPARKNDAARFACDLQRNYFREMKTYLRSGGVRIPLTAVTRSDEMPDLKSVADELDFIGNNFYWDHPFWTTGQEWQQPTFFMNGNPLMGSGTNCFSPSVMMSKIQGVPLVVREWNYCWPNRYRAVGIIEAVAYGSLQDVDALILFSMGTHDDANRIDFFDVHLDPVRWGIVGMAAKAFLQRDISPADLTVNIAYSPVDTFSYIDYESELYRLGLVSRVQNELFDAGSSSEASLTISSGRSAMGKYPGTQLLLRANRKSADLYDQTRKTVGESLESYGFPLIAEGQTVAAGTPVKSYMFDGTFLTQGRLDLSSSPMFTMDYVTSKGFKPIGVSNDNQSAYGFYDPQRRNFVFHSLSDSHALRVALDALGFLHKSSISRRMIEGQEFTSDTGQVRRNSKTGRMVIDSSCFKVLAGNLNQAGEVRIGSIFIAPSSEVGAILVSSLDSQPIEQSRRIHIKCVSNAENSGQIALYQQTYHRMLLAEPGSGPIRTFGSIATRPTRVVLGNNRGIEVYQENGVWELLMEYDKIHFFSDTPNVPVRILHLTSGAPITAIHYDGRRDDFTYSTTFIYPPDTGLVTVDTRANPTFSQP